MTRTPRRGGGKVHPDAYSRKRALELSKEACREGYLAVDDRVYDQLLALGVPLDRAREAIEIAMEEVGPDHYKRPDDAWDPPGHGFFWYSPYFRCQMYLKVRLEGPRPRCKLYSLHPPEHELPELRTKENADAPGLVRASKKRADLE